MVKSFITLAPGVCGSNWTHILDINVPGEIGEFFEWNSTFFAFSLIIEGTTEKLLQFIIPLKSAYNENHNFNAQKWLFEHYTIKIY